VATLNPDQIDRALPQTQCTKCGYNGCRPYAQAIVFENEAINRCPPGGEATLAALALLTGRVLLPLDVSRGVHKPLEVAIIDETLCIGCTLCITACPVDAIIGAPRQMHVIVAEACSGCELCIAPCPVDCISMKPASHAWDTARADAARARHEAVLERPRRLEALTAFKRSQRLNERRDSIDAAQEDDAPTMRKRAMIEAALARARARRSTTPS